MSKDHAAALETGKVMKEAGISVIIPSYDKAAYIGETLDSVLAQNCVPVEVIVVDDGSTDGSREIISGYGDRVRACMLPENRGAAAARNRGAAMATGEFLMFLDADDLLAEGTLAALAAVLRRRGGASSDAFAACRWRQMRKEGEEWISFRPSKPLLPADGDLVRAWLNDNWYFPPCAVLWPRELYERSGGWAEELRILQDADIMVRMLLRGARLEVAEKGEACYRVHGAGDSLSNIQSAESVGSRLRFLDRMRAEAVDLGLLPRYRNALARAYYQLSRTHAAPYPELAATSLRRADRLARRAPFSGTRLHRILWRVLGLERKERLTAWLKGERRGGAAAAEASGIDLPGQEASTSRVRP